MTKIALTKAPTSLLECAVYISARKKLIDAMSLDIDRPINRAVVVGCAISATRDYLKLHMSRTLKVLWCNTHAKTRKLWKRSAVLPPLEACPSIISPAARYCTRRDAHCTLFGSPNDVASCSSRAYHRERRRHATLIALVALPGATLPATSCLGAFWTPATTRRSTGSTGRRPKTST